MIKNKYIKIFNNMIRGTPIPLNQLLSLVSEYLTENNIENSEKVINLISQNPEIINPKLQEIVEYLCKKYNILILKQSFNNNNLNFLKTILYYE